jgi:H+/Cl- antiporter ClcA
MKKEHKKIYWYIVMIWGVLACISSVGYALSFKQDIPLEQQPTATLFWNFAYWSCAILCVLAIVFALCFALTQVGKGMKEDWKKQIGIIIAIVGLVLIFIVGYLLSSGTDIPQALFDKTGSNYSNSKLIGAGLYMCYILFGGVVLTIVYTAIASKLK